MNQFKLEFWLRPTPKQRPRFDPRSGKAYSPDKTRAFEQHIAMLCRSQMALGEYEMLQNDVGLDVTFHRLNHGRADIDNLLKALLDGLDNGGLYQDDRQVIDVHARIEYGARREGIIIWEIGRAHV